MAVATPMLLLLLSALLAGLLCSPVVEAANDVLVSHDTVLFNDDGVRLESPKSIGRNPIFLSMQADCNLVIINDLMPRRIMWMSNTSRTTAGPCYLEVSPKGELHIHEHLIGGDPIIWSCGAAAHKIGSYALDLRAGGTLLTYGPPIFSIVGILPPFPKHRGILNSGYTKTGKGTILRDGENELLIDDSNRLVTQIYGPDGKTLIFRYFVSPPYPFNGHPHFEFTSDGGLVYSDLLVHSNGVEIKTRVWSSGVTSNALDYICALPDLAVYRHRQLVFDSVKGKAICGVVPPPPNGDDDELATATPSALPQ